MKSWARSADVVAVVAGLAIVAFGCGSDTFVGGGCKEGLSECSLKCVDLRLDPRNCGACGHACGAGEVCSAGLCSGGDGGTGDASADASPGDGASGDGSLGD